MTRDGRQSPWWPLFLLTASLVYVYVLMEWIFLVTKPSFMSGMTAGAQLRIFLLAALGTSVLPLSAVVVLGAIDRFVRADAARAALIAMAIVPAALIAASLVLILVDNFTYTVFGFGIVSTERFARAGYGLAFLALGGLVYVRIRRHLQRSSPKRGKVARGTTLLVAALLGLSLLLALFQLSRGLQPAPGGTATGVAQGDLPDIILLGSDGLDANHLSAYGYERQTTPRIDRRLDDALMIENAFPNAGTTAGSVASILTGKPPLETGVIYPPDILREQHAYQHLPGMLRRLGYHTVDISVPYFGDALTLNLQGGFDVAGERSGEDHLLLKTTRLLGGGDSAYFVDAMWRRISDRLLHLFFIRPMTNPYEAVIEPAERATEQRRFDGLIAALDEARGPVFIHVHMLGTHGPRFEVRQQVFSAGRSQGRDWMVDFYDDAILSFDSYAGELFDHLEAGGRLDDTIVVLYSDHGMAWRVHQRVPLLFWFPGGEHAGRIQANAQNLDIAPTLLDYLGLTAPEWMGGESLLRISRTGSQYIFSASVDAGLTEVTNEGLWAVEAERRSPPFFQLGYVGLVACDRWFELYLQEPALRYGTINGHTADCAAAGQPDPVEAQQILLDHLARHGYDISSFPGSIPVQQRP